MRAFYFERKRGDFRVGPLYVRNGEHARLLIQFFGARLVWEWGELPPKTLVRVGRQVPISLVVVDQHKKSLTTLQVSGVDPVYRRMLSTGRLKLALGERERDLLVTSSDAWVREGADKSEGGAVVLVGVFDPEADIPAYKPKEFVSWEGFFGARTERTGEEGDTTYSVYRKG